MCMRYRWSCRSEVPFTEEEIKRFIQKLKTKLWLKYKNVATV